MPVLCHARLGDTLDQAQLRYGTPKEPLPTTVVSPLIEGAKEYRFEYEGWRIRCALLQASDGDFYVVREQYTKGSKLKATGKHSIQDYEVNAILTAQAAGGKWEKKILADKKKDVISSIAEQIGHTAGLKGTIWVRKDGASATLIFGGDSLSMELPQAAKYEAELKAIRDAKARASVPKF